MLKDPYLTELKQQYFDVLKPYTHKNAFEKKQWDFYTKAGQVEVNAGRGEVFEKVCVSDISATVTIPDRDYQSSIQWVGIQTFPSNPMVPMLMGVFERVDEQGLVHHPGFFDVYPVVPLEEDRRFLADSIGAVCKKYSRKYPDLPDGYLKMFRLKEAGIGVGYGAGLALMPDETDQGYLKDASQAILKAYLDIVEKKKDSEFTPEQAEAMNRFRADWVRFIFSDNRFYQGGVSLGVPPESFMLHMLPPTVRF